MSPAIIFGNLPRCRCSAKNMSNALLFRSFCNVGIHSEKERLRVDKGKRRQNTKIQYGQRTDKLNYRHHFNKSLILGPFVQLRHLPLTFSFSLFCWGTGGEIWAGAGAGATGGGLNEIVDTRRFCGGGGGSAARTSGSWMGIDEE